MRSASDEESASSQRVSAPRRARSPSGPVVHELRPRRAEQQQRAADVAQRVLEEVEERLVRPVEVLDEHDRRPARRRAPRGTRPTPGGAGPGPRAGGGPRAPRGRASSPGSRARRAGGGRSRDRSPAGRGARARSPRAAGRPSRCRTDTQRPMRRSGSGERVASCCQSSWTSVVLPTPASPIMVTSCGSPSSTARPKRRSSNSSSCCGRRRRGGGRRRRAAASATAHGRAR